MNVVDLDIKKISLGCDGELKKRLLLEQVNLCVQIKNVMKGSQQFHFIFLRNMKINMF